MNRCPNKEATIKKCNCSYPSCSRKGVCCECIAYHRGNHELPACYFSSDAEKKYDRSIQFFISLNK